MAMRDEVKQQRDKLRGKGFKAHWDWFVEYELAKVAVIAFIVIFAIVTVVQSVTSLPYAFGVMFINADLADDQDDLLEEEFAAYAGIDLGEYQMLIDLTTSLSLGDTTTYYDYTYQSSILARTAAEQLDAWVSDAWTFESYANKGEFLDLRDVLDEETLSAYEEEGLVFYADRAVIDADESETEEDEDEETITSDEVLALIAADVYELPDPGAMEDPIPLGIVVTEAAYITENHNYDGIVSVFGFVTGGTNTENAIRFLEYLFDYQGVG